VVLGHGGDLAGAGHAGPSLLAAAFVIVTNLFLRPLVRRLNTHLVSTPPFPRSPRWAAGHDREQLRRIRPVLGPGALVYVEAPMSIDFWGPRGRIAMMKQAPYLTNPTALAGVKELQGRPVFHRPFILEKSGRHLWILARLARAVKGPDENAPFWRKATIHGGNREAAVAEATVSAMMTAYAKAYESIPEGRCQCNLSDERIGYPVGDRMSFTCFLWIGA
jgi:hypothetical protein